MISKELRSGFSYDSTRLHQHSRVRNVQASRCRGAHSTLQAAEAKTSLHALAAG